MVSPAPPDKLTQLLKYEQIEYATGSNFVIVVTRYFVPM